MKTQRNIFIAFILNLLFSVVELAGGLLNGSVAILSDALHDLGDAVSIGISFFLERKSKRPPDDIHTYGYARYSVLGGAVTTLILLLGSAAVIANAISRLFHPTPIDYNGMILFACIGVVINLLAAYFTRERDSINQKAVNLHMLEDVLGWVVVLLGAIVMRFTDLAIIDPLMSVGVATFIFLHAVKNLKSVIDIFLEKIPEGISVEKVRRELCKEEGIVDVHHIHIWSIDGIHHSASMHIRTDKDTHEIKEAVRNILLNYNIHHATLETESSTEHCHDDHCIPPLQQHHHHHHHHHHH